MIQQSAIQRCGPPIVVASHMRSGTHLMIDLLRRQFADCRSWKWPGEPNDMLYLPLDALTNSTPKWRKPRALKALHRTRRPIIKTHWTLPDLSNLRVRQPELADWIASEGTFLHVVRNPFDVLASQWAWDCSIRRIPPARNRPTLQWIDTAISSWTHHYGLWSQWEKTTLFRFEDTLLDPNATLERLADLLGESPLMRHPLLPEKLTSVWHSRWNRLTGIHPASTEIITEGGAPDPSELFTDAGVELIKRIAGGYLTELSYDFPGADAPVKPPLGNPPVRSANR